MKITIHVRRAGRLSPSAPEIPSMVIQTGPELRFDPRGGNVFEMQSDAERIVEAFIESLPQGTIDRVFALLARRAAGDLIVRAGDIR